MIMMTADDNIDNDDILSNMYTSKIWLKCELLCLIRNTNNFREMFVIL